MCPKHRRQEWAEIRTHCWCHLILPFEKGHKELGTSVHIENTKTLWWELDLPDHTSIYLPGKPYSELATVSGILLARLWIFSLPAKYSCLAYPEGPL